MARTTGHVAPAGVLSSVLVGDGPQPTLQTLSAAWRPSPRGAVLVAGSARLDVVSDDNLSAGNVEASVDCRKCGDALWPILVCQCPSDGGVPADVCLSPTVSPKPLGLPMMIGHAPHGELHLLGDVAEPYGRNTKLSVAVQVGLYINRAYRRECLGYRDPQSCWFTLRLLNRCSNIVAISLARVPFFGTLQIMLMSCRMASRVRASTFNLDSLNCVMMLGGSGDDSRRGSEGERRADGPLSASESVREHSSTDVGLAAYIHRIKHVFSEGFLRQLTFDTDGIVGFHMAPLDELRSVLINGANYVRINPWNAALFLHRDEVPYGREYPLPKCDLPGYDVYVARVTSELPPSELRRLARRFVLWADSIDTSSDLLRARLLCDVNAAGVMLNDPGTAYLFRRSSTMTDASVSAYSSTMTDASVSASAASPSARKRACSALSSDKAAASLLLGVGDNIQQAFDQAAAQYYQFEREQSRLLDMSPEAFSGADGVLDILGFTRPQLGTYKGFTAALAYTLDPFKYKTVKACIRHFDTNNSQFYRLYQHIKDLRPSANPNPTVADEEDADAGSTSHTPFLSPRAADYLAPGGQSPVAASLNVSPLDVSSQVSLRLATVPDDSHPDVVASGARLEEEVRDASSLHLSLFDVAARNDGSDAMRNVASELYYDELVDELEAEHSAQMRLQWLPTSASLEWMPAQTPSAKLVRQVLNDSVVGDELVQQLTSHERRELTR